MVDLTQESFWNTLLDIYPEPSEEKVPFHAGPYFAIKTLESLLINEFVAVQPMTTPRSEIFHMRFVYGTETCA